MNVKLLNRNTVNKDIKPIVRLLLNRGMPAENISKYITTKGLDGVNSPDSFGEELMRAAAKLLIKNISANNKVMIIVDSDVDGLTSSAILINYLYDLFPSFVLNNINWVFHQGKQHGLKDHIDALIGQGYGLVICPDSGTNDVEEIKRLYDDNTEVLILDHHLADVKTELGVVINSQYNYNNPALSGAGVVWQFCRFLDKLLEKSFANDYLDLCALGLQGDMMDIQSLETRCLIFEGFKEENIKNPFIDGMVNKNEYSFSKSDYLPSKNNGLKVTPIGMSFFCIPMLNAICRSGTMEEKSLVFDSLLKFKAFEMIPSNKRGHKTGEMERVLDQVLRMVTNVKNRQTRAEDAGLELLEKRIEELNLLDHKVLLCLLEPGEIDKNIAGLVANKLMAKYQRPCIVSTKVTEYQDEGSIPPWEESIPIRETYQGSMRGYTKTGVTNFKGIVEAATGCEWCRGHEEAAGICLSADLIDNFLTDTDNSLSNISDEPIYYVDYEWLSNNINGEIILDLADANDYIGTGFDRPLVYIKDIEVNENTFKVMKSNTLKYSTKSGIDIIQFGGTDEEIEKFSTPATKKINAVCKCCANIWNFEVNPQLVLVAYEEVAASNNVVDNWGF